MTPLDHAGGDLFGAGIDLSLWRGGNPGLYLVGGVSGGFGVNGAEAFWGSYSVGGGYDFRLFSTVGLAVEARWRGPDAGRRGRRAGGRSAGARYAAEVRRLPLPPRRRRKHRRAVGATARAWRCRIAPGQGRCGDGARRHGHSVHLGRQQRRRLRLFGTDPVRVFGARDFVAAHQRGAGAAGSVGRPGPRRRWRQGIS